MDFDTHRTIEWIVVAWAVLATIWAIVGWTRVSYFRYLAHQNQTAYEAEHLARRFWRRRAEALEETMAAVRREAKDE